MFKPKFNVYVALIYRLTLVMIFAQLCRVLFFAFSSELFPDTALLALPSLMAGGLVFDLTAALYVNSIYILMQLFPLPYTSNPLYQKISSWVFYITNGIAIILNIADIVYYKFNARRATALVFEEYSNESNGASIALQYVIDYWYLIVAMWLMIWALVWCYKRIEVSELRIKGWQYVVTAPVLFFIGVVLFIGGVRGGFAHSTRPITISNATQYINHLGEEAIVLNTPFSMLRTLKAQQLQRYDTFSEQELVEIYDPIHRPVEGVVMTKKNVVVLIVESLSSQYVGAYNRDNNILNFKSYTPFLDSLIDRSVMVRHSFATGKKSIDAMASVFASIPSLEAPFVLTPYSYNKVISVFSLLKQEGYNTSFFHGAPNGSMGFKAFAKKLEIDNYYGKAEYDKWRPNNSDFDGVWGVSDNPFFEFWSKELSTMPQPFISSVFTLTSHHPFKLPPQYEGQFDTGTLDIHKVVGYTDMALRRFFERSREQEWYKNSIFVIVGDHTSQNAYPEYNNLKGQFSVPIIFFDPSLAEGRVVDKVGAQIDIFPTIMNYLGYEKPFLSFGFDLLSNKDNFVVNYLSGQYNLYWGDELLLYRDDSTKGVYRYKTDVQLNDNLKDNSPQREALELRMKAFLQQFNNRMLDDRLSVK